MPFPIFWAIGAGIAALIGTVVGVKGGVDMKKANDKVESANSRHKANIENLERQNITMATAMDDLGKKELEILKSFGRFSELFEKIHNKPQFEAYYKNDVDLPKYNPEELKNFSLGATVLLSGLASAVVGTAGGFAASGATTAAVVALGKTAAGVAIASLKGIAATNATLAAIGGGSIAAGGGGMALGAAVLGVTTLGVGILVGGVIFGIAGSSLSDKADEAFTQMLKAETEISKICEFLKKLESTAIEYTGAISRNWLST